MTAIGRRKDSRLRADMQARLITLHGSPVVALRDLSQSGARMHTTKPLTCGESCVLNWLSFEAFGTIVWFKGGLAGMEFDELLPEQALLTTRAKIDSGAVQASKLADFNATREWYINHR